MPDIPGMRIIHPSDVETMVFDWGTIKWMSEPRVTNTRGFSMGVVLLQPGKGHQRHNHPGAEEILYIISGRGNQMIDIGGEKWQPLSEGDVVHIPADVYHASINTGWEPLKMVAVYCPPGPEALLRTMPGVRLFPPGEVPKP